MLKHIIFLFFLSNCATPPVQTKNVKAVMRPHKTKEPVMCITLYNPVCGINGKTYSNSCNADVAGVAYSQGECEEKK